MIKEFINYKTIFVIILVLLFLLYIYYKNQKLRIDMVFTYVDGNDPALIQKKIKYSDKLVKEYNPTIRYENINEIYFSVNSVVKFIPWINKIYIVTDDQMPPIDDNLIKIGKVEIISHKQIIPEKYLPTFNSDVIESYLHNIPNLSEIFLYNNDDMMHLDYLYMNDIFEEDGDKIRLKLRSDNMEKKMAMWKRKRDKNEYQQRIILTSNILKNLYPNIKFIFNHHTKILRKSTMKYIDENFDYLLSPMRLSKFRNNNYIQYLFFVYCIDNLLHNDIIIYGKNDVFLLTFWNEDNGDEKISMKRKKLRELMDKKYKFVCFNNMDYKVKEDFYNLMLNKLS